MLAKARGSLRVLPTPPGKEITPENTRDTYVKSWWVWGRFTTAQGLPLIEGTRGSLVAFVTWMLREGQQNGKGYAASSASTILAGVVVGLRGRGCAVSRDDQAAAAEVPDLYRVVHACPDTLAGARDKALILTGFHYASRAQDPAGCTA